MKNDKHKLKIDNIKSACMRKLITNFQKSCIAYGKDHTKKEQKDTDLVNLIQYTMRLEKQVRELKKDLKSANHQIHNRLK